MTMAAGATLLGRISTCLSLLSRLLPSTELELYLSSTESTFLLILNTFHSESLDMKFWNYVFSCFINLGVSSGWAATEVEASDLPSMERTTLSWCLYPMSVELGISLGYGSKGLNLTNGKPCQETGDPIGRA